MDTDALTSGLLQELRATRPYPALSLTMPTHRRAPDNAQDAVRLRNLVAEAGTRLDADPQVTRETRTAIKEQLDRAATEVDPAAHWNPWSSSPDRTSTRSGSCHAPHPNGWS
ncbi:hypothetical protein NKH18_03490 [Streptomyces sp. M10(2022)]